jgi:hypothetical protein
MQLMSSSAFRDIALSHFSRYPLLQIEDLYKLAYQATLGSEHAVQEKAAARTWLLNELDEMSAGPNEPLLDEIAADGNIVRVHLQPFISSGGDPELLLQAFIRTANEYQGSTELLQQQLEMIGQLSGEGALPFHFAHLSSYFKEMEYSGFPAVHHSTQYQKAYQPSYRVVCRDFLSITP